MRTTVLIVALAVAALCPTAARADTLVFVEDFSDESGNPAFDPLFNHSCVHDDPYWWDLAGSNPALALLGFHMDTITFNLQPEWSVIGASVESFNTGNSARFIGTRGTTEFAADTIPADPPLLWHSRATDVGEITAIELSAGQGWFDNVTIEVSVIPEPSTAMLLFVGSLLAVLLLIRRPPA